MCPMGKIPDFFTPFPEKSDEERFALLVKRVGKEGLLSALKQMVLIRHFEIRGESAYQHGFVGGFYHAYSGQEAIQTAATAICGPNNWYVTTYRCHALALLLGESPDSLMAELYGKESGNARGRGGSMHLYSKRLLGGFGIVGGHLPIAAGAAFASKYLKKKGEVTLCFLGEGAVAQGAFHEALNLSALWSLPVIYVIENNLWGMGTHVTRALATEEIAKHYAYAYGISGYTLDGMNYTDCYFGFDQIHQEVLKTGRPVLVECLCERFRGHSISDPALYRNKEELQLAMGKDPLVYLRKRLEEAHLLSEAEFAAIDKAAKEQVLRAMKYAEEAPLPSPITLEEGVYAT